jgi:hypothetical protein
MAVRRSCWEVWDSRASKRLALAWVRGEGETLVGGFGVVVGVEEGSKGVGGERVVGAVDEGAEEDSEEESEVGSKVRVEGGAEVGADEASGLGFEVEAG